LPYEEEERLMFFFANIKECKAYRMRSMKPEDVPISAMPIYRAAYLGKRDQHTFPGIEVKVWKRVNIGNCEVDFVWLRKPVRHHRIAENDLFKIWVKGSNKGAEGFVSRIALAVEPKILTGKSCKFHW
jgi:hypothetical protein